MYNYEKCFEPLEITRNEFIEKIFTLGSENNHGLDSIIESVQLGDLFVNNTKDYIPYVYNKKIGSNNFTFIDKSEQIYSNELAHIVTIIIAKFNEDNGYNNTFRGIMDTSNFYIVKIERDICNIINYTVKINNILTYYYSIFPFQYLNSDFYYIFKDICHNKEILYSNPFTIIISLLLLNKHNKLKSLKYKRFDIFCKFILKLEYELESTPNIIINELINIKTHKS